MQQTIRICRHLNWTIGCKHTFKANLAAYGGGRPGLNILLSRRGDTASEQNRPYGHTSESRWKPTNHLGSPANMHAINELVHRFVHRLGHPPHAVWVL